MHRRAAVAKTKLKKLKKLKNPNEDAGFLEECS